MKKPPVMEGVTFPAEVQRRLDALETLIDTKYDGSVAAFCERTGIKTAQISQWFSGYRMLREKALDRVAVATGKPVEWFNSGGGNTRPEQDGAYSYTPKVPSTAHALQDAAQGGWHSTPVATAAACTELLGSYIAAADTLTRSQIAPLLGSLVEAPDRASELGARLQATLAMSPGYTPPALPGLQVTFAPPPQLPAVRAPQAAPAADALDACIEQLSTALAKAGPMQRSQAAQALQMLVDSPGQWRMVSARLRPLLKS